jgi:hypothetical protein
VINTIYLLANLPKTSNSNSALRCIPIQIQILHMIKYQIQMTDYSICPYMLTYFFEGVTETLKWQTIQMAKYHIQMRSNETPQMQKKIPCKWLQKFRLIIVLIIVNKIQKCYYTDNCHVIQNIVDFQAECVQKLIKTIWYKTSEILNKWEPIIVIIYHKLTSKKS